MPGVLQTVVAAGWLGAMPLLLLLLGGLGWRHDRVGAVVCLVVAIGFLAQLSAVLTGRPSVLLSLLPVVVLAGLALGAFGLRLWRDRRLGHERSTAESLAVLAMGAIFLLGVLSLPGL